jgi:glycosyltransferase involved in cell wall biosynthesis
MTRAIAVKHDVWLITRQNNVASIQRALESDPSPGLTVVGFDLPAWARFWKRGQRGVQPYYYLWQFGAYLCARSLHRAVGFDIAHHLTFVKYWTPSLMALLPIPFVWGPVGGGESAPAPFWPGFGFRGRFYELTRKVGRWVGECDPLVRLTARRSWMALATTPETAGRLERLGARRVQQMTAVALPDADIRALGDQAIRHQGPVRFLSVGRLLHLKGFHLALLAFAQANLPHCEYWLVGEGPERRRLEELASSLRIEDRVRFWGALPRDGLLGLLPECDVLVHPGLHESGSWVCLEAMAGARPVICFDLGGPGVLVTDRTGIKVPARMPEEAVDAIASAMRTLARDSTLRSRLGSAARSHVEEHYRWCQKAERISSLYREGCRASLEAPIVGLNSSEA